MNYLLKPLIAIAFIFLTISVMAFAVVKDQGLFTGENEESALAGFQSSPTGYDLARPGSVSELPKVLLEVSGLTDIDENTLACVQDEDGVIFIYDLKKDKVVREIEFAGPGDYEGISRVGNSLYVLRSDGKIFEIDDYRTDVFKVNSYKTDLPVKESEGLGFDAANNRLFIAGKTNPKGDEYKGNKVVYGFDLTTKSVSSVPVFAFSQKTIERAVASFGLVKKGKKKDKELSINPSGIAIHPITNQLYVLSSMDRLLYVFNLDNEVEGVYPLSKKDFAQPEGITFLDNGDMFISNEGKKGEPTLLRFFYGGAE